MSGLCGVFGRGAGSGVLGRMLDRLAHRGPSCASQHLDENSGIALGHVHLESFASPAERETPSFGRSNGFVAAVDGTAIGRDSGFEGATSGDPMGRSARAVLSAYEGGDPSWLSRLDGPFGLALWDAGRRRLVLARDRLGEKPLYYASDAHGGLAFASEIRPLLAGAHRAELDREGLALYFAFGYIPGPRTLFRGISKLLPGESLTCEPGSSPVRSKYWTLPAIDDGIDDEAFCVRRLRELFLGALERYVAGADTVGVYLSGGLDSSIIVAGLRELGVPRIATFTIGFDLDPANARIREDLRYARLVADAFATEHHEVIVGPGHDAGARLPRVLRHFDDLVMTPNVYSKHLLAEAARDAGVASVLTGSAAAGACGVHRKFLDPSKRERLLERTRHCASDAERYYLLRSGLVDVGEQARLFREPPALGKPEVLDALAEYIRDIRSRDFFRLFLFSNLMITSTEKTLRVLDRTGAMASVEVRAPYLDRELVEFSTRLPSSFDGGATYASLKTHMKKAFERDLPRPVLERAVQGYPSYYWNRGELAAFHDRLLSREALEEDGIFQPDAVARIVAADRASVARSAGKHSWAILQFSLWHRIHVRGGAGLEAVAGT